MLADDGCFLLTYWGTLVCFDTECGMLTHRDLFGLGERYSPARFSLSGLTLESIQSPFDRFQVVQAGECEPTCLRRNGLFVCALVDGELEASRTSASDWENFVILPGRQLEVIRFLLLHDWIENSSRNLLRSGHNRILSGFRMRLGTLELNLLQNLPISLTDGSWKCSSDGRFSGFRSCAVWVEKWRPVQLTLYRPLVFYCAFGKGALAQLSESVRSLIEIGNFQGELLVLSDVTRDEIERYFLPLPPNRLHVMNVPAYDKLDFCSARYRISEWELVAQFQPLLYVDTDVAFDLDPEEMLLKVATSSKLSAQRERGHFLSAHAPVGADMLRAAGIDAGEDEGFNSGIIGIPHISDHRLTLMQIHDAIYRYVGAGEDRRMLTHFDQPVANFVAFVTRSFDLDIITPYVRWMHSHRIHGGSNRLGLVHFWGALDKLGELRQYVDGVLGDCE